MQQLTHHTHTCSDLDQAESFLQLQTTTCTALFALTAREYALAAELTRFVASQQRGGPGNAGVWVMRGLGFAGIGELLFVAYCEWLNACELTPIKMSLLL